MKKELFLFLLLSVLPAMGITGYQAASPDVPVAAGWNLLSFPVQIAKTEALGASLPAVFQFSGGKWERFTGDTFQPNKGYFMDFEKASAVKIPSAVQAPIILQPNWNAMGVSASMAVRDITVQNSPVVFYGFLDEWAPVETLSLGKGYLVNAKDGGEMVYTKPFTGDNFDDGDYTKNPEWKITLVPGQQEREVRSGWLYGRNVLFSVPSKQAFGTWSFTLIPTILKDNMLFSRMARVYFIASEQDMITSMQQNGYYLHLDAQNQPSIVKVKATQEETIPLQKVGESTVRQEEQLLHLEPRMSYFTFVAPVKLTHTLGKFTVEYGGKKFEGIDTEPIMTSTYLVVTGDVFPVAQRTQLGTTTAQFYIDNIKLIPRSS